MQLYHIGDYIHTKERLYARYFFNKIAQKSREMMSDMLILQSENPNDEDESNNKKRNKKKGKNKNRKRKNKDTDSVTEGNKEYENSESKKSQLSDEDIEVREDDSELQNSNAKEDTKKFINEINFAIKKKKDKNERANSTNKSSDIMDDDYGSENAVSKASPVAIGNPQTTDEYNKDQEYINNNLFTLVDNDLIFTNASENLELNETPLKVEDYDDDLLIEPISNKISENSSSYANYMHDTRSEGSKEDNQRLESIIPKEKGKNNSKNKRSKNKRGNNQNKNKNKDNNKNRKIVEPKLEEIKKANSYTDDPHVDNDIILKSKDIELNVPLNSKSNQARKGEHDKRHDNRKKEHVAKNIVDVKSSKSEDKRANNPTKHVTSTNPASEGSSMKDPNNHDAKFKSDSKPKTKETIETTNNDWIQTEKKIKQKVTKSKRGQKSDRRQYKASKASEQISKPVNKSKSPIRNDTPFLAKKNSDEPNPPSSSIWNQEIVQAIFSPQEAKAPKKGKKKSKDTKKIVK